MALRRTSIGDSIGNDEFSEEITGRVIKWILREICDGIPGRISSIFSRRFSEGITGGMKKIERFFLKWSSHLHGLYRNLIDYLSKTRSRIPLRIPLLISWIPFQASFSDFYRNSLLYSLCLWLSLVLPSFHPEVFTRLLS